MKSIPKNNPAFEQQLLNKIHPEIAKTFTFEQLDALKRAFGHDWNRHPIDIRVSIPILGRRFYLVLLAGRERRSNEHLQVSRRMFPLWTPVNTLLILGFFILLLTSGFITLSYVFSSLSSITIPASPFATSLPFIKDQSSCEQTGRVWRHDQCWDSEQNPSF